ncbi:hypothetical protein RA2_02621 [Roseovarius sp. A-2]|uniref:hypothetical protein n=1 Tax=Roseovarius sp. A-2 TaxID=1570360 RepID=UPI0009B510C1|nr:hypothetical protein [Roseovarius sp. A-2]GAW35558.1 hypothetical protein RA2_02621 [Roseovarius sp. A-2]
MTIQNISRRTLALFFIVGAGGPLQAEVLNEAIITKVRAAVVACAGHQLAGQDLGSLVSHGFTGSRRKDRWGMSVSNPTIIGPSTVGVLSRSNLCRVTVTPGRMGDLTNLLSIAGDALKQNGYDVTLKRINYYVSEKQFIKDGKRLDIDAGTRIQYGVTTMEVILKKVR